MSDVDLKIAKKYWMCVLESQEVGVGEVGRYQVKENFRRQVDESRMVVDFGLLSWLTGAGG